MAISIKDKFGTRTYTSMKELTSENTGISCSTAMIRQDDGTWTTTSVNGGQSIIKSIEFESEFITNGCLVAIHVDLVE